MFDFRIIQSSLVPQKFVLNEFLLHIILIFRFQDFIQANFFLNHRIIGFKSLFLILVFLLQILGPIVAWFLFNPFYFKVLLSPLLQTKFNLILLLCFSLLVFEIFSLLFLILLFLELQFQWFLYDLFIIIILCPLLGYNLILSWHFFLTQDLLNFFLDIGYVLIGLVLDSHLLGHLSLNNLQGEVLLLLLLLF